MFHRTLVPMLRKLTSKDLPWPDQVKFALFAVRVTPNRSTGYPPFEIIHGQNLRSSLELVISELDPQSLRNIKAYEWIHQLQTRVAAIREEV